MYGYIKGIVKKITPQHIIVDNHGIGYLVISPTPYQYRLEEEVQLSTYLHVREDIFQLYGFKDDQTLELFLKLLSVSGIGPKSALSIVAYDEPNKIILAIEESDAKYLTKFPGIGMKSAQQIILDLKGKLVSDDLDLELISDASKDVSLALEALGYNRKEIAKALKHINTDQSVDQALKEALAYMLK
ncbi:Holliday junction ATP-dependent DNA helicase RuvA [Acholeplasma oculi]|uniref:Holliday junction branch migration complex subunit RuvA n=1 Tax=Acholeplasma oculi TaxID=35623 RepID=A0A061AHR9_9MOLU|nr:Holliday junction branch migration protein RuvA [Acholeplasma oculi]CDR31141.1 Holliday junction DNA helicase RuvA [Acholeplasma oculi]SKC37413.1 Holliday junction DNA helicase subunit RuvA [Acholeplasma oculi]SUT90926.1 Holliday junction ATP-dependent DNA helicase RuvA [Acholeplasma oculi]